ncbi:hypothetical protein ACLRDI_05830 [Pseudomonas piscis]|uniref:hypothetical protein n=1 Tax=Pseudomonas piscis TaxID=2614538 RepID=UPI0039A5A901
MRIHLLTATAISIGMLAGCSSQPKAFYEIPPLQGSDSKGGKYTGNWEGLPTFTLAKSQLVFSYVDEKKTDAQMISVPAEAEPSDNYPSRFLLRQDDSWGVDTHLKVTLLASIGTEVEDKRVKYIEGAGSLLVGLIGAAALDDSTVKLPISIDSYKLLLLSASNRGEVKDVLGKITNPGNKAINFKISFGGIANDAIDVGTFATKASTESQKTIFYSACRNVSVTFLDGPLGQQQFSATIADPRYVQTVKYPEKGSIEFHTSCGANTTSSASGASSSIDLVNAVIAQTKTVREAWTTKKATKAESNKAEADFKADKTAKAAKALGAGV